MKIALSGPSGLGKSTLCKHITKSLDIHWQSTSAGDVFLPKDIQEMKIKWGYDQSGHRDVINRSSFHPDFGAFFQDTLLRRRQDQIENLPEFVIDRCPIDNVAYMLSQVGHNMTEDWIAAFIKRAQHSYSQLTHVIRIEFSRDITFIEENGSRIPNMFFQAYMSDVFRAVYIRYFANISGPLVMTIDHWNLEERKKQLRSFLLPEQLKLGL